MDCNRSGDYLIGKKYCWRCRNHQKHTLSIMVKFSAQFWHAEKKEKKFLGWNRDNLIASHQRVKEFLIHFQAMVSDAPRVNRQKKSISRLANPKGWGVK